MTNRSTLRVAAGGQALDTIRAFVEHEAQALDVTQEAVYTLMLAVEEIAINIVTYGYRGLPGPIEVSIGPVAGGVEIQLRDQAPLFDPTQVAPPDITLPLEQRAPGGLGIHLARRLMDSIQHRALPQGGNELTLIKRGIVGRGA